MKNIAHPPEMILLLFGDKTLHSLLRMIPVSPAESREISTKFCNKNLLNYSNCYSFLSPCEYSLTISIKAIMINKDFLYIMWGQGKEITSILYYSHFDCNSLPSIGYMLGRFDLWKAKRYQYLGLCFFKLTQQDWRKEVRKCA